jgi:hypothetical protein
MTGELMESLNKNKFSRKYYQNLAGFSPRKIRFSLSFQTKMPESHTQNVILRFNCLSFVHISYYVTKKILFFLRFQINILLHYHKVNILLFSCYKAKILLPNLIVLEPALTAIL